WYGLPEHEATWEREAKIKHVSHWRQLLEEFQSRQGDLNPGRCHARVWLLSKQARAHGHIGSGMLAQQPEARVTCDCCLRVASSHSEPTLSLIK
ncbi:hypothetical protein PHMEG_00031600, partial [Phytophthora megakarya]